MPAGRHLRGAGARPAGRDGRHRRLQRLTGAAGGLRLSLLHVGVECMVSSQPGAGMLQAALLTPRLPSCRCAQLPLAEACHVAVQRHPLPNGAAAAGEAAGPAAGEAADAAEPAMLRIVSLATEGSHRSPSCELPLAELVSTGWAAWRALVDSSILAWWHGASWCTSAECPNPAHTLNAGPWWPAAVL